MDTQRLALDRAIEAAGGARALAKAIENTPGQARCTPQAIYSWTACPPLRVIAVEAITGVSRHELRGDIYPPEKGVNTDGAAQQLQSR